MKVTTVLLGLSISINAVLVLAYLGVYFPEMNAYKEQIAAEQANADIREQGMKDLRYQVSVFRTASDSVAALERRKDALYKELDTLDKERRALIPRFEVTSNIACTGSMDPTITCLDTITVLTNPMTQDIEKGVIISYRPYQSKVPQPRYCVSVPVVGQHWPTSHECADQTTDIGCYISNAYSPSDYILHRVIDTRMDGDEKQFRTQGDNNPTDDGCWVPFDLVKEIVISVEKGSDVDGIALLDEIWERESRQNTLLAAIDERLAVMDVVDDVGDYNNLLYKYNRWVSEYNASLSAVELLREKLQRMKDND
jgi:hypothetical protein